jgi:uncharacterized surface protein with fasciclin (FAS1) repeats
MRARQRLLVALSVVVAAAGAVACGGGYNDSVSYTGAPKPSDVPHAIPDVLEDDPQQRFTTLLTLVEAADLGDALSDTGPLTVFAPTNDAFNRAFTPAELEALGQNLQGLRSALGLHVSPEDITFTRPDYVTEMSGERGPELKVDGRVPLEEAGLRIITEPTAVPTLEGSTIIVRPEKTLVGPQGSRVPVVQADLQAPNGYIQVIGGVLGRPTRA